jgi:hypothetical protein
LGNASGITSSQVRVKQVETHSCPAGRRASGRAACCPESG